jgi:hypothetical protein
MSRSTIPTFLDWEASIWANIHPTVDLPTPVVKNKKNWDIIKQVLVRWNVHNLIGENKFKRSGADGNK